MKTLKRVLLWVGATVGVIAVAVVSYVLLTWDKVYDDTPMPALQASTDPAVIEHGKYLVRGPAHCSICHMGSLDEVLRSDAGDELPLRGGLEFPIGPIVVYHTANLTQDRETGIARYTDGQLFRMLRHNVKPDGRASLAPLMPFANMADDDLVAIVSYLRASEAVHNEVPAAQWKPMGKAIAALLRPAAIQPVVGHSPPATAPAAAARLQRGPSLAHTAGNCTACHAPPGPAQRALIGRAFVSTLSSDRWILLSSVVPG